MTRAAHDFKDQDDAIWHGHKALGATYWSFAPKGNFYVFVPKDSAGGVAGTFVRHEIYPRKGLWHFAKGTTELKRLPLNTFAFDKRVPSPAMRQPEAREEMKAEAPREMVRFRFEDETCWHKSSLASFRKHNPDLLDEEDMRVLRDGGRVWYGGGAQPLGYVELVKDNPQVGEPLREAPKPEVSEPFSASEGAGKVVVTRHKALAKYLVEIGLITKDDRVIEHATSDDVRGKDVIGVLPIPLAALARSVTEVPIDIPAELRGKELTLAQIRKYARPPQLFRCEGAKKCEVCGHILDAAGLNKWGNPNCAGGRPHRVAKEGASLDEDVQSSLKYLKAYGPLTEIIVGPTMAAHLVDHGYATRSYAGGKGPMYTITPKGKEFVRTHNPQVGGPLQAGESSSCGCEANEGAADPVPAEEAVPWVKITRDPAAYEEGMKRAKEIGPIDGARQVYELLSPALAKEDQEVFLVVLLDVRQQCLGVVEVHRGERDRVSVSIKSVLRPVTKAEADSFIVVHNHPTGDPTPSPADIELTKAIMTGGEKIESPCVDHIVIGRGRYYSFADAKQHRVN